MAKKTEEIITLSDIEHILLRPGMYIGQMSESTQKQWLLDDEGVLRLQEVTFVPSLLKVISEALDNSIDAGIKTDWKKSNRIEVTVDSKSVKVKDNGSGIPVRKNTEGEWTPVIAFTKPRTGSNFGQHTEGLGTHGLGIKGANIFSTKFEAQTCDGKKRLKLLCTKNLSTQDFTVEDTPGMVSGTQVKFVPDLKRFGVTEISDTVMSLVKTRLRILSWFYPKCSFYFNGDKMNIKAKEFSDMLPQPCIGLQDDTRAVFVYPSEDQEFLSYVNGLSMPRGGSQVDYVSDYLVNGVREKLQKKYKTIKPGDIRSRLGLVVLLKGFPNCQFDSQTKESLGNTVSDVRTFMEGFDLEKLLNRVLKEKVLMDNVTELYKAKEQLKEEKQVKQATGKRVDSDKYYPPISGTHKKYLFLTEGQSAMSGISRILGRKEIGYYCLKGKVLNPEGMSLSKIMANQEVADIVNILGLDLVDGSEKMQYDYVVALSDADMDGIAITSLIINLFNRLNPNVVKAGKVCRLNTPLCIGLLRDKVQEFHYSFPEQSKLKKRLDYHYLKGLGSWEKDWLNQVIEQENGLENMLLKFGNDGNATENLRKWFGSDTAGRKQELAGREFHIDLM